MNEDLAIFQVNDEIQSEYSFDARSKVYVMWNVDDLVLILAVLYIHIWNQLIYQVINQNDKMASLIYSIADFKNIYVL